MYSGYKNARPITCYACLKKLKQFNSIIISQFISNTVDRKELTKTFLTQDLVKKLCQLLFFLTIFFFNFILKKPHVC